MSASADPTAPAIVLDRLEKRFGAVTAIAGVSLVVARGEFVSLLGPSGSGKTTILRMIGGFEHPTSGRIVLDGADVQDLPAYRRNIGVVFQKYALFPHMTAAQNVEFPLKRRGVARPARSGRVADALALVGLDGLGERYPEQLSGGQQQRVALARAVVFGPQLLLLDEPLGALDKQLRDRMQKEIRALQRKLGITTIFVTHDQSEAMAMSDRIAVINKGLIEQVDAPDALYERPRTGFVAGFIGDSNLLPCTVLAIDAGDATLRLAPDVTVTARAAGAVVGPHRLLLRPERLRIGPPTPDHRGPALAGTVAGRTFQGDAMLYAVTAGALSLTVKLSNHDKRPPLAEGTPVTVAWDVEDGILVEP